VVRVPVVRPRVGTRSRQTAAFALIESPGHSQAQEAHRNQMIGAAYSLVTDHRAAPTEHRLLI
jgi:hypothetical protein